MIHTKPCLAKIWNAHGKPEPMNNCDLLLVPQVGIKDGLVIKILNLGNIGGKIER